MAEAKERVETISRIILELSWSEAEALRFVLQHVGGCPERSGRKYIQNIDEALSDARVPDGMNTYQLNPKCKNSEGIFFAYEE